MARGRRNPNWELATRVAKEMQDETQANIARILAEFKRIREAGFSPLLAYACWQEWTAQLAESDMSTPRIGSVLRDGRLQKYQDTFLERIPPVWDSSSHDTFVRENAETLSILGWVYRGGRISEKELETLGIKREAGDGR